MLHVSLTFFEKAMIFRLHNGTLVTLENNLADLSQKFMEIHRDVRPFCLMNDMIKKSSFKKQKAIFYKVLEDILPLGGKNMTDEDVKQLFDGESKLSKDLLQKCKAHSEHEVLEGLLNYLRHDLAALFEPMIHHIKFVKDDTFLAVIDFLQIASSERNENMFDNLSFLMQGLDYGADFKSVVNPALHGYIDYIRRFEREGLMELCKAACLLGIKPLITLIACRIAQIISESNEKTFRQEYAIPNKFRHSIVDKIRHLVKAETWGKMEGTVDRKPDVHVPFMDMDEEEEIL